MSDRRTRVKTLLSFDNILIIAIAIGIALRLIYLTQRELWYDEVLSLLFSTGNAREYINPDQFEYPVILADYTRLLNLPPEASWGDFFTHIEQLLKGLWKEPHPPWLYLSLHGWIRLFGNTEAAMRSLFAIQSIIAIASIYGLGRIVSGHRLGLLLCALLAVNPFFLYHSLNLRMYGPLLLWTALSAWAVLKVIDIQNTSIPQWQRLAWNLLLIGSVAAGFMTFYLFAFFITTLGILVLLVDRQHWWQQALRLSAGVAITTPWLMWGTDDQLRNSDVDRFGDPLSPLLAFWKHLQDIAIVLGNQLITGNWGTDLPPSLVQLAGLLTLILLLATAWSLWNSGVGRPLTIASVLGFAPLLMGFAVDVAAGKYTLGWGNGRSAMFILPGCLLLLALWIDRRPSHQRPAIAATVLGLYLAVGISNFTLRQRTGMAILAQTVEESRATPTLISTNTPARGHVLRFAYYIDPHAPVELLARSTPDLIATLPAVVADYPRVIWLDSVHPIHSEPATSAQREQIASIFASAGFDRIDNGQQLPGSSSIDRFTMSVYER